MTPILLIGAIVAGWMVQMYLTYQQSMAFNRQVRALTRHGTVSVGVAGKRYRGGRSFVAVAIDDHGIVRAAITLGGWTTFARGKPLAALVGVTTRRIVAATPLPGVGTHQHEAARQAVDLAKSRVPV